MDSDLFVKLRNALREDAKHRVSSDTTCGICGSKNSRFAFHVIETSFVLYDPRPGFGSGSIPVCELCAPPCKKCGLPIVTKKVMNYIKQNQPTSPEVSLRLGNGVCTEHIHILGLSI